MAPASRSRPSAACTGVDAPALARRGSPRSARSARATATRSPLRRSARGSRPPAARRTCRSRRRRGANDSAVVAEVDDDGVGSHEHELAAAVDAEADPAADEHLGEVAQPLGVIDDHTVVAQRVPPSSATTARARSWRWPVRHRSTLDVNATGSISVDDLRALVDADPQQALRRRRRAARRAGGRRRTPPALWWIAGRRRARRSATPPGPARRSRRPSSWRGHATTGRCVARVTISLAFDVGDGGDMAGALPCSTTVEADVDDADRPLLAIQRGILDVPPRPARRTAVDALLTGARTWRPTAGDPATELKALGNLGAIESQQRRLRRRARAPAAGGHARRSTSTSSRGARWRSPTSPTSRRRRATCPRRSTPSPRPRTATAGRARSPTCRGCYADHAAGARRRQPARRRRAPHRPRRRRCRRRAATTSSTPSCCWSRPRSTSPRASRTRPTSAPSTPSPRSPARDARAGCTSPSGCGCAPRRA